MVFYLGVAQFVAWGISYYLLGALGDAMSVGLGWSRTVVHGGFAAALLMMGIVSGAAGRWVDRWGGRNVMAAGSLLLTAGCLALAAADGIVAHYAAWLVMGIAMRLTLYDAAFAALAQWLGPQARRPMAQITLLGGLASSAFWPLGHALAGAWGWRGALVVYAALALLTAPLHLALPRRDALAQGVAHGVGGVEATWPIGGEPLAAAGSPRILAGALFAAMTTLLNFLNAGMSAHTVGLLAGLGLALPWAVGLASLRGVGQSCARLADVLWGGRCHPLALGAGAALLLPLACLAGLWSGQALAAALVFVLAYGSGNGLLTITRGTAPLVLFDHRTYGAQLGRMVAPGFVLSACAPVAYAAVIDHAGAAAALGLSVGVAALAFAAALALWIGFAPGACRASTKQ
ncbi:MFS transporter [Acidovorax sp. sic0104]|uniref:MFS transporter n=1 Tax=Acidovorax sp. sic0104 TaxID=2854784 RepID=UPI0030DD8CDD